MNIKLEHKNTLLNFDLKSFLEDYSRKDISKIRKIYPDHYRLLADQIDIYPKAKKKLPTFAANYCYFTKKGFEQSTSEILANYKASLFKGNLLLDLTGGFGADDAALSRSFAKVISIDNDEELNSLARINLEKMGLKNIERIDSTAEEYMKRVINADLVYIDPDRRPGNKRNVTLNDSVPRIPDMIEKLFEISESILLKLSPLIDLTYLKKNLPQIAHIYVISLENEVKEVLVLIKNHFAGNTEITAVDLAYQTKPKIFTSKDDSAVETEYSSSAKYFFEPSKSLIKAGLINGYAADLGLKKAGRNSPYLLGQSVIGNFMGRVFEIINSSVFSKSVFRLYLKEKAISKANISRRDFPLTVDELRKQYKIADGGDEYLFFTSDASGKKMFYHCRKTG